MLVVGSNSTVAGKAGLYIGKYENIGTPAAPSYQVLWSSSAIVPIIGELSAPVITGIAADQNYVYITSYGTSAAATKGLTKAEAQKKYSPRNLMSSSCADRSKLVQGLNAGGVTVYTTQWNGVDAPNMNKFLSYDASDSSNFFGTAVLGVSLQVDPVTHYAKKLFVPSITSVCDQGGYSVGRYNDSGYSYAAPTATSIACFPSGEVVNSPYTCSDSNDIGKVIYVEDAGRHGLIAALADQGGTMAWSSNTSITGATALGIGDGRANTDVVVSVLGSSAIAPKSCIDVPVTASGITYADWFLPSGSHTSGSPTGELYQLYTYKTPIGGFISPYYWSSSEVASFSTAAFNVRFTDGNRGFSTKTASNVYGVRCIRAF